MYVADYDVMKLVDEIQKENGTISEVYFVACGGSLIDLYSSNYFVISVHDCGLDSQQGICPCAA